LKKLFAGIHCVVFANKNTDVSEMKSQDSEIVPLRKAVRIETNVEVWLGRLAEEMKTTLSTLLMKCLQVSVVLFLCAVQTHPSLFDRSQLLAPTVTCTPSKCQRSLCTFIFTVHVQAKGSLDPTLFPSQILCLSEQIRFTMKCEESISQNSLQQLKVRIEWLCVINIILRTVNVVLC
jgi:dynein heavy chain 2